MDPLDNPVWHALTGPQATVADGRAPALRYALDVAPFCALPDAPDAGAWAALAQLVGPARTAALVRHVGAVPQGWSEVLRVPCVQMVATAAVEAAPAPGAVALGDDDVAEMQALVDTTRPGPFLARTIVLGEYVGVRIGGALAAMAGERMRPPGYGEISSVCTDPAHRGRGLASMLVRDLVGRIRARGDTPMLHVVTTNTAAISLYAAMGFAMRREIDVVVVRAP